MSAIEDGLLTDAEVDGIITAWQTDAVVDDLNSRIAQSAARKMAWWIADYLIY